MRRFNLCLLICLACFSKSQNSVPANLVMENIPEIPLELMEQMTQYQNTRSASLLDWHPVSGKLLISTRFAETPQLHTLSQPLGARTQITFFKEPVTNGRYCPDANYNGIIYSKD